MVVWTGSYCLRVGSNPGVLRTCSTSPGTAQAVNTLCCREICQRQCTKVPVPANAKTTHSQMRQHHAAEINCKVCP